MLERKVWDDQPSGRRGTLGGVPIKLVIVVVFGPGFVTAWTMNPTWLFAILPLWLGCARVFGERQNLVRETLLWVTTGSAFASTRVWGGASEDPHGSRLRVPRSAGDRRGL